MIPFIPQREPQLTGLVYEMVLAHLLNNDRKVGENATARMLITLLGNAGNNQALAP
jgi:hypothetical protein